MSYILDALRKAERERNLVRVPTIATVHDLGEKASNHLWIVVVAIIFFAAAASVLIMVFWRTSERTNGPTPQADQITFQPAQAEGTLRVGKPAEAQFQGKKDDQVRETQTRAASQVQISPFPASTPTAETSMRANEQTIAPSAEASDMTPKAETAQEAYLPLREAAAKMKLSILMYSEDPTERLVFINGTKYLEGDYVEDLYLLESITPEGALLRQGEEQILVRPGAK